MGRWYQNHGRCSVALKVNDKWWFGSYKAPKNGDFFSFSGGLSFILSNCDPKCQALQLIFHCCHPDTLATGMDLTQWSYKNDQAAGCLLKVII